MEEFLQTNKSDFYCGFFLNKTPEWMQKWIAGQFTSSSSIKSLKKKKEVQSSLELISNWLEHWNNTKSAHIFVNSGELHIFELEGELIHIICKYLKKDDYWTDTYDREYWLDLYYNNNFWSIYEPQKEKLQHYYFTRTKFEKRDRVDSQNRDYLQRFPPLFYICTKTNQKECEQYSPIVDLPQGNNIHTQLVESVKVFTNQCNQKRLEEQWADMEKTPDLFMFGNEVVKAIKDYQVKEVFCYQKFRDKIEANMDGSLLNFTWVVVEDGLDKFNGIFGRRYFSV